MGRNRLQMYQATGRKVYASSAGRYMSIYHAEEVIEIFKDLQRELKVLNKDFVFKHDNEKHAHSLNINLDEFNLCFQFVTDGASQGSTMNVFRDAGNNSQIVNIDIRNLKKTSLEYFF